MLKKELNVLVCPTCKTPYSSMSEAVWKCGTCGLETNTHQGIPLFTPVSGEIRPFEKRVRGAELGTPWRNANWHFLQEQVTHLDKDALILDVGAGRGDFAEIFKAHACLAVDVYPYPEVDVVCDLTQVNPFSDNACDAVALMNVLEHVYNPRPLLGALYKILKPGGVLWIAVPFLLKIHQSPFDFYRYTHHALVSMVEEAGFTMQSMDGYYDPIFLIGEGLRNVQFWETRRMRRLQRVEARLLLSAMRGLSTALQGLTGKGRTSPITEDSAPAPIGYHLVLCK